MSATKSAVYVEGIGRRKTATARVRLTPAKASEIVVNDSPITTYFKSAALQQTVTAIFATPDAGIEHYQVSAHVIGGGLSAQAEAIRLGIARALVREKAARRKPLKREGFLMRDQRSVERKKFGLRKARKRPQWSKR